MTEDKTRELKMYVKAVLGGHVIADNWGYCKGCGDWKDLRSGYCFNCVFTECPLEKCNYNKLVYNTKHERIVKDMRYIDRKTGKQYCDRPEGLCATAKNILNSDFPSKADQEGK